MQWLLHGNLTPAVGEALRRHGHKTHELTEIDLSADSSPPEVLKAAGMRQWEILTADPSLVQAPYDLKIPFARCMVFLQLEGGDVEQDDAVDRLFQRYKRLTPGRLYTVTASRVKIRQLPNPKSNFQNPKLED